MEQTPGDDHRPPALRASDADRERHARILHTALGEGRITLTELDQRLGQVYAAKTLAELTPLVADLPAEVTATGSAPAAHQHALIGGRPGSANSVAIFAGTDRKGNWVVPPRHTSVAFCGGVQLDLRTARFAEAHTTITCVAIMGGIEVIVPDDITVEVTGIGVMGAFDSQGDSPQVPSPNAPVVRVTGFAFWGGVTVKRMRRSSTSKHLMR